MFFNLLSKTQCIAWTKTMHCVSHIKALTSSGQCFVFFEKIACLDREDGFVK